MIVVTGASGFIGRALVSNLAKHGVQVLAATRRSPAFEPYVQHVSLASYADLKPMTKDDTLIHLAEPNDLAAAALSGLDYETERRGALSGLLAKGWGAVVYASSAVVYGDRSKVPCGMCDPVAPSGAYAKTKLACEKTVLDAGGTVARLANVYGPGMATNNVLSDILRQIPGDGPIIVRNRKPVRDYIWIADAADALTALAVSRRAGIWNVGTGVGTSVLQLAQTAIEIADQSGRDVVASLDSETESNIVLDVAETSRALDWQPRTTVRGGLANLLKADA